MSESSMSVASMLPQPHMTGGAPRPTHLRSSSPIESLRRATTGSSVLLSMTPKAEFVPADCCRVEGLSKAKLRRRLSFPNALDRPKTDQPLDTHLPEVPAHLSRCLLIRRPSRRHRVLPRRSGAQPNSGDPRDVLQASRSKSSGYQKPGNSPNRGHPWSDSFVSSPKL